MPILILDYFVRFLVKLSERAGSKDFLRLRVRLCLVIIASLSGFRHVWFTCTYVYICFLFAVTMTRRFDLSTYSISSLMYHVSQTTCIINYVVVHLFTHSLVPRPLHPYSDPVQLIRFIYHETRKGEYVPAAEGSERSELSASRSVYTSYQRSLYTSQLLGCAMFPLSHETRSKRARFATVSAKKVATAGTDCASSSILESRTLRYNEGGNVSPWYSSSPLGGNSV